MENTAYVNIQGWMVNELQLKGNELMIYAIIYGFSQDGKTEFRGSRQYLADWTNSSKRSVQNCLNSLVEKGYIERTQYVGENGSKETSGYIAIDPSEVISTLVKKVHHPSEKSSLPLVKKVHHPSEKSSLNNTRLYTSNNNLDDIKEKEVKEKESQSTKTTKTETTDSIVNDYTQDNELLDALQGFVEMRKKQKKPLTVHALKLNLKTLDGLAVDDHTKAAIVNQSIEHSWLTFYALKNNQAAEFKTREEMGYAF